MKKTIATALLSLLTLQACSSGSSGGGPSGPVYGGLGPVQPIEVSAYEQDAVGLPIVKTLDFGTLASIKTGTITLKNSRSTELVFAEAEEGRPFIFKADVYEDEEILLETTCGLTLAPGASCQISVTLDPATINASSYIAIAAAATTSQPPEGYIFGQTLFYVQIKASLPGKEEFLTDSEQGALSTNTNSGPDYAGVSINNSGPGLIRNLNLAPSAGLTILVSTCPSLLESGNSCQVIIKYSGTTVGTLAVTAEDAQGGQLSNTQYIGVQ